MGPKRWFASKAGLGTRLIRDIFIYLYTGNIELLEAAGAHYEVLQGRGGSERAVTEEFHLRLLGGVFGHIVHGRTGFADNDP